MMHKRFNEATCETIDMLAETPLRASSPQWTPLTVLEKAVNAWLDRKEGAGALQNVQKGMVLV
jgi:hypothetical protein